MAGLLPLSEWKDDSNNFWAFHTKHTAVTHPFLFALSGLCDAKADLQATSCTVHKFCAGLCQGSHALKLHTAQSWGESAVTARLWAECWGTA